MEEIKVINGIHGYVSDVDGSLEVFVLVQDILNRLSADQQSVVSINGEDQYTESSLTSRNMNIYGAIMALGNINPELSRYIPYPLTENSYIPSELAVELVNQYGNHQFNMELIHEIIPKFYTALTTDDTLFQQQTPAYMDIMMIKARVYFPQESKTSPNILKSPFNFTKDTYPTDIETVNKFLSDYCVLGSFQSDYILSSELEDKFREVYPRAELKCRQFATLMSEIGFMSEKIGFRKIPEDRGKYGYRGLKKKFDW